MSEENEHYFEALDNDGDREIGESFEGESRQQRINRMFREQANSTQDSPEDVDSSEAG